MDGEVEDAGDYRADGQGEAPEMTIDHYPAQVEDTSKSLGNCWIAGHCIVKCIDRRPRQ